MGEVGYDDAVFKSCCSQMLCQKCCNTDFIRLIEANQKTICPYCRTETAKNARLDFESALDHATKGRANAQLYVAGLYMEGVKEATEPDAAQAVKYFTMVRKR
jgi:hypothetical protein